MQDDKKTINEKELATLKFWEEQGIFEKSLLCPGGESPRGTFSFYDGPPFATGLPHHGTIMAGTVKDVIPRYQTMKGNSVRRVWGWDCHGLPIENLVEKKLGLASKKDIETFGIDKFNRDAYESVLQYEEEWKKIIPRLGRWVDMEHPYKTMDATYTESVWWAWKELMNKGLAYEGNKMMHICPRCETPLAQSEVGLEYHDVTDLSVTAKFELVDEPGTYVLAWTTTPWTLPGNTALAVNKGVEYVKFKFKSILNSKDNFNLEEGSSYVVSLKYFEENIVHTSWSDTKEFSNDTGLIMFGPLEDKTALELYGYEKIKGSELVGKKYKPVFPYFVDKEIENKENIWKIWHADFITEDAGTGIAHEAPAFGAEDMDLAKAENIPVIKHVKMDGTFTSEVTDFAGMKVKVKDDTQSADIEIIKWLAHNGKLFEKHKIVHSYPLCWRCKTPLLNYATSSWFIDVPHIKEKLIAENQKIGWTPEHVRDGRFGKWLEGAREWAVSRSRYWGAPLPVWKNKEGKVHVIGSLKELAELNANKAKNTYYVMRHGQAHSNVAGIIEIGTDATNHLTEIGKEQVIATAETLKGEKFDLIISSPVLRAHESSLLVSEALGGVPVIVDERLHENNVGIFNGTTIDDYLAANGKLDFLRLSHRPEGGETHQEIQNRMMALLMECEKNHEGKKILFVSHGGPLRMMIAGATLCTEEEILADESKEHVTMYLKNGEVKKMDLAIVPRDETGAINLHRPYIDDITLHIDGEEYTRIPDVFDCWYESGSMPFASLHYPFENKELFAKNFPADFIAESMDQTRGWFYSLINLGVGLFDKAPYKHVICNGIINAADGKKISKSLNNYTDPLLLVEKFGADAFRYYLMSSSVIKGEIINFDDKDLEEVYKKVILRAENMLSLYEMNVLTKSNAVATSPYVLDRWIISRVHQLVHESTRGYESYSLDEATRGVDLFIDDLSVWYVRRSRDRLKGTTGEADEMHAKETLTYVLLTFAKIIAPIMPFLAERVYRTVSGEKESVHLESWPLGGEVDVHALEEMLKVREVVSSALSLRTQAKISVRQPLQKLTVPHEIPSEYHEMICDEINVKELVINTEASLHLDVTLTPALIQEGDVRNLIRAVQDARKEKGLFPKDLIVLTLSYSVPESLKEGLMNTCNIERIEEGGGEHGVTLSSGSVVFGIQFVSPY